MTYDKWLHDGFNSKLRHECLKILMAKYGHIMEGTKPKYSQRSIYECANDWINKGHKTSFGIVKYFKAYYK